MVEFIITDLFLDLLLHLPAILLFLILAFLLRNISTDVTRHRIANRSHSLGHTLVADLPGDPLAGGAVAEALCFLVPGPPLQLADLLGLEVTVLPFHRAREGVCELLAILLGLLPANFNANLDKDLKLKTLPMVNDDQRYLRS